ncbi:ATP-binding protein [Streptomyces kaniharaensis]|uniref:ATP-binding protein n=1 Tax=Streptomyces kaniharaensis TaxID=212423 RepID=A0A6N7L0K5_9ACTN|nr:ATP-binding protein [Streptomyces kaniharaensis]MQS17516.1 ATP-binding protein [Streptomyces kaniharaensis]
MTPLSPAIQTSPAHTLTRSVEHLTEEHVSKLRGDAAVHCHAVLHAHGRPTDRDVFFEACVVTSEFLSNVARHAASPEAPTRATFYLQVLLETDEVLIVVFDRSSKGPQVDTSAPGQQERGLGLGMVHSITNGRWGWFPLPDGKAVWAICPLTWRN